MEHECEVLQDYQEAIKTAYEEYVINHKPFTRAEKWRKPTIAEWRLETSNLHWLQMLVALCLLSGIGGSLAIDNGVGLTPPMGWRHWKAFYADINQGIIEEMMHEMTKKYDVDGVPTSLKDLGYLYVGLDDHWQNCTRTCANGTVVPSWLTHNNFDYQGCDNKWHNGTNNTGSRVEPWYTQDGTPRVDTHRFPDLKGMTSKAHSMGLRAGWYMGNFQCRDAMSFPNHNESWDMATLVAGSVRAITEYGFDSVKIDSGFPVGSNLSMWADLLNASGRPVMIENCHQGGDAPGLARDGPNDGNCTGLTPVSDCPFNFWRTAGDPEPGWGTIMRELNSLRRIVNPNYPKSKRQGVPEFNANPPRSRPGGWAYPGTMVVGDGSMTKDENKVHFGSWCIVSSPLILAFNLSDPARHNLVWDIITNKEAITVNQAWAGHPGAQVMAGVGSNKAIEVWTKPLGDKRTAVFILNTDASRDSTPPANATIKLADLGLGIAKGLVKVRDVWQKKNLPPLSLLASISTSVNYHGSVFLILMSEDSEWPLPFELAPWMKKQPH